MVLMMVGNMMVMIRIMMVTMVMKIAIKDALVTMACVILAYHVKVKGEAKLATII